MTYGTELVWVRTHDGKSAYPIFLDGKVRSFTDPDFFLYEQDYGMDMNSKEYIDAHDPLRSWYFLTDEEQSELFRSGDFSTFLTPIDVDKTDWNPARSQVDDYRRVMEMTNNFVYKDLYGDGTDPHVQDFDASIGLRRVSRDDTMKNYILTKDYSNMTDAEIQQTLSDPMYNTDLNYILENTFPDAVENLVRTQKEAAAENGYREFYGNDPFFDRYYNRGVNPPLYGGTNQDQLLYWPESEGQTTWSARYLDKEKDLVTATSADMLQEQIDTISTYTDRTTVEKDYLTNKAICRYWVSQMSERGQSDTLVKSVLGTKAGGNPDSISNWLTMDPEFGRDYTGDAMPWSNSDDRDSIVPGEYTSDQYDTWQENRSDATESHEKGQAEFENKDKPSKTWDVYFNDEPVNILDGFDPKVVPEEMTRNPMRPWEYMDNPDYADYLKKKELWDAQTVPEEDQTDEFEQPPWIRYKGQYMHNPKFTGNDYGPKPVTQTAAEPVFEAEEDVGIMIDSSGWDLPSGYYFEDPSNPTSSLIKGPEGFLGTQNEMWADQDARKAQKQTTTKKGITDWENALRMVEEFGNERGLSRNPDDWYDHDYNDNSRPTDFVYVDERKSDREQQKAEREAEKAQNQEDRQARRDAEKAEALAEEQHLNAIQEYTFEEHGIVADVDVTPENYPWLAFTEDGTPALFADPVLGDKLHLPDNVIAVQQQNGVIHTSYIPGQIQPAFAGIHEASHTQVVLAS